MKSTQYSDKVLDHFRNPRNVGSMEGDDVAVGKVGNPVCGDLMEIYIKVKDEKIADIKFKTFGCGSAIATSSMITEMARGKSLEEALKITRNDVADELDGLPPIKMHCSNLAADALKDAIKNYREKQKGKRDVPKSAKDQQRVIVGLDEFANKGVYRSVEGLSVFRDKRVMIIDRGEKSIELAIKLTGETPRVVFVTASKDVSASPEIKKQLKTSDVKILFESELLEIKGANEVEKVVIHDTNEDETYELFVDSIIIL